MVQFIPEGKIREQDQRSAMLFGLSAQERLRDARVAVFGLGGVGGMATEALARSGIGTLMLIDADTVNVTNINRQVIAVHSSIGMKKTEAMAARVHDISPETVLILKDCFYLPETADKIDLSGFDFVVDAIDTVTAKIEIACRCKALGIPVISAMGAGNRVHPEMLKICDLFGTSGDPLCRVMRSQCRKRGINALTVACSEEQPRKPFFSPEPDPAQKTRRDTPGSSSFVPPAMGLMIASHVVNTLMGGLA